MIDKRESKLDNPDMQAAPQALLRAARRAREIARKTGTPLVIVRDGVLIEIDPDDPRLDEESGPAARDTVHDG
jgi:hypothetical protein